MNVGSTNDALVRLRINTNNRAFLILTKVLKELGNGNKHCDGC